MQQTRLWARWFGAAMLIVSGLVPTLAAEPKITLLPGTDLPGYDYSISRDTTLDACQAACADDRICRAFTFNEQSRWCFLKADAGDETAYGGATSGRVERSPTPSVTQAARQAELPFPADYLIDSARELADQLPTTDVPPPKATYSGLVSTGGAAMSEGNPAAAIIAYRQALGINGNDPAVWLALADAALTRLEDIADTQAEERSALAGVASAAAMNAFLRSESVDERAGALRALAYALEFREMYREAIASYRASMALVPNEVLEAHLEEVVAQHGFRISSHQVDADAASPRICAVFSQPLSRNELSSYVVVPDAPRAAIETVDDQICIEGLEHGRRYAIRFRAGLSSADGETLGKDVALDVYVPDRAPFVGFANTAYVMPSGLGGGLPISSVNAETAEIMIYRIGDRSIAMAVRDGVFAGDLSRYSAENIADETGELVFEGEVELTQAAPNAMVTTAVPVGEAIGAMQPGAYVITARVKGEESEYWRDLATQWFIVTDLGLTTVQGDDGVHAFVRSLTSADPVAGAAVRLVARNNDILGEGVTDADGRAIFAPGLARGEGGRAPQLLVAETEAGDYAFLDLSRPAFDLTDRGVEGRPSPGPLDVFATTERGVYRPGETVFFTALLRDDRADAVTGMPLTLEVERPDGVVANRQVLEDGGAGGYFTALPMAAEAMRGSWTLRLYADPKAQALSSTSFLVEDFEPERLAFELTARGDAIVPGEAAEIDIAARYLYGATAPGLAVEADAIVRPRTTLPGFAGYTFGREDDPVEISREPLGVVATTDEAGEAVAEIVLPEPVSTTRPLEAQILLRLVDTNGRTVERSITRPVVATGNRLGIRPAFGDGSGLEEGSEARFDIIAVSPDNEAVAVRNVDWRLSRIETSYQWYRDGSRWRWEAITTPRLVASGTVDIPEGGPVSIGANVDWGLYRLEVESGGRNPHSSSYEFYAGFYYPDAGSNTPDTLEVALDRSSYRVGDTARLRLEPQFAGKALVMVVDNRIISMEAVDVPEGGATVSLPVTEEWGPGAYVTATLYRPADAAQKRMPARALGLAFAGVDPGDRRLDVTLDAPGESLPRQSLEVTVELGNVAAGTEAYVAVAAVDLGILNLTNFQVPAPDDWYFGQRQLGVEIRDLYGQLIDPTQGLPGALRSGGDGGGSRLGTPPPTTVLVAQHSGIVEVGEDGTATVTFDMPDFAGTVRIMAMAWTEDAVGHASADVIVRDPVVVTLSPPRFLRVGDESRLLVEVNNVSGEAGSYSVGLALGDGIATEAAATETDLAEGERIALDLGLSGLAIGDWPVVVTLTQPDGSTLVKELLLGVRPASAMTMSRRLLPLPAGEAVTVGPDYLRDYLEDTGEVTLAIGPLARLDVPGLLQSLSRYPYGCSEQVSSRALPLLYLEEVASRIGLGDEDEIDDTVADAITAILAKQNSSGGFGLWGPYDGGDFWLDGFVTDFLMRASDQGYDVPELALTMALDNLANQLAYASDFDNGGEAVAYALYDLARAGRAAIGDLRYYLEARLDAFATPLAQAQLGAALALYGDQSRAAIAFDAAVEKLRTPDRRTYRDDYGSHLRDLAGVITLAAEFYPQGVDLPALANQLAKLRDRTDYTSTQEDTWTLLAAAALGRDSGDGSVTVGGEAATGAVYRRFTAAELGDGIEIANTGDRPTEVMVSTSGYPVAPPEPMASGFELARTYYLPDGTEVDPTATVLAQNERLVVVIDMWVDDLGSGQYLVADPLPAGFEIENPNLSAGEGASDFDWLELDQPAHVESRTDQYVAAFRFFSKPEEAVTTAYMVRATSPGTFVLPGTTVEDMYRPERRAVLASGAVEVSPAGR